MKMSEEVNRILTDRVSDILFCPTDTAVKNLKKEGYPFVTASGNRQKIVNIGDVMLDGAMYYKQFAKKPPITNHQSLISNNYILCTIHRAENTDDENRLRDIFEVLNEIAKEKQIILPLHPRTKKIVFSFWSLVSGEQEGVYYIDTKNQTLKTSNLIIIEPVGYLEMVWLLDNCKLVITDSGGLQKEAYFFKKPCITLRDETEWVELVEHGYNTLVGANKDKIIEGYSKTIDTNIPIINNQSTNLFGDGKASEKIIEELIK